MAFFLEAFNQEGVIIGGLFAGRGWIWAKDYRNTQIYRHLTVAYDNRYPRYARVRYYEIRECDYVPKHGNNPRGDFNVLERIDNRYYRERNH